MHRLANSSDLLCSISSNGDCVALCTPDGVIKFYDTLTSNLKLEYSSSTHLQAGCSCLVWSRLKRTQNTVQNSKQKKLKTNSESTNKSIETELNDLDLIALGTTDGSILIYSLSKASLHTQLSEGGHSDKVNDISWCPNYSDSIYSCSDDGYIVEWSLLESKVKAKWKASKTAITSISIDPTNNYLICSSKTITVWDLKSKTKVKTLTGHSNDIFKLQFLSQQNQDLEYFFSAAHNDRILNAWTLNSANITETSNQTLQSFTLNDGPSFLEVISIKKNDKNLEALVLALTHKGQLCLFKYDFSSGEKSNLKKPLKPINTVKLETKEGSPLKIYAAFLANSKNEKLDLIELGNVNNESSLVDMLNSNYLYIVYGSHVNPRIEKIEFSELNETKKVLKRDDPFKTSVTLQTQATKIESPIISKDVKVLVPGQTGPQTSIGIGNQQKRKSTEPSQMTLEERLNVMGLDETNGEAYYKNGQVPKTDNLLVLLVQGLQSNDSKMLNHILQHKNDKVIAKTVRMLPTNYVVQLIKELNKRLQGHAQSGLGLIKWLKSVLMIHTSYLMSYPDLIESLGSVYEMMNARTKLFPQLSKLQGKLQLVMSQVTSQAEDLPSGNDKEPLLYYQDSTSEDEQIEDELIPSHSEFDEYVFSDEEDEEESIHDDDDDQDENMVDDGDTKKILKKEVVSFKKKKELSKGSLLKKNKKDESEDDDDEDEEDDEEEDAAENGENNFGIEDDEDEDDDDEDDE